MNTFYAFQDVLFLSFGKPGTFAMSSATNKNDMILWGWESCSLCDVSFFCGGCLIVIVKTLTLILYITATHLVPQKRMTSPQVCLHVLSLSAFGLLIRDLHLHLDCWSCFVSMTKRKLRPCEYLIRLKQTYCLFYHYGNERISPRSSGMKWPLALHCRHTAL